MQMNLSWRKMRLCRGEQTKDERTVEDATATPVIQPSITPTPITPKPSITPKPIQIPAAL